jgi:hypothetical protein
MFNHQPTLPSSVGESIWITIEAAGITGLLRSAIRSNKKQNLSRKEEEEDGEKSL